MSIVGYVLGYVYWYLLDRFFSILMFHGRLGDRHGENILFDELSGDVVHVDFNCLFEKVRHYLYFS